MSSLRAIQGKDVNVSLDLGAGMLPWACATSCSVDFTTELVLRTSVGGGNHKKYKARSMDATAELNGVSTIVPATAGRTVFEVLQEVVRMKGANILMEFSDSAGNYKSITGYVLFPSISISAGADGFSEDTIQMQFSGVPGVFNEPPPSQENSTDVDWNLRYGANGETGFIDTNLLGRAKVAVYRTQWLEVITSGTPTFEQVKYNSSTGQLLFGVPLGPDEPVFYQWKQ